MRLPSKSYRLRYGLTGFGMSAQPDGLEGSHAGCVDNLCTAGLESLGTLPAWPVGGMSPGEVDNGAAGRGLS